MLSNLDLAPEVFVPSVALGELVFGAAKSGRPSENTARVERFASGRAIVSADLDVAREYGRLKQYLKKKGRPLPENDISIAAAAKCHEMVLVTRDLREIVCTPQIGPFIRDVCLNSVQPVAQIPTLVSARLPPNLGVFLQ